MLPTCTKTVHFKKSSHRYPHSYVLHIGMDDKNIAHEGTFRVSGYPQIGKSDNQKHGDSGGDRELIMYL